MSVSFQERAIIERAVLDAMAAVIIGEHPTIQDADRKFQARMLLSPAAKRKILVPTRSEWIGIGLLERDGELPKRR